jgi:hypothetical protein
MELLPDTTRTTPVYENHDWICKQVIEGKAPPQTVFRETVAMIDNITNKNTLFAIYNILHDSTDWYCVTQSDLKLTFDLTGLSNRTVWEIYRILLFAKHKKSSLI